MTALLVDICVTRGRPEEPGREIWKKTCGQLEEDGAIPVHCSEDPLRYPNPNPHPNPYPNSGPSEWGGRY